MLYQPTLVIVFSFWSEEGKSYRGGIEKNNSCLATLAPCCSNDLMYGHPMFANTSTCLLCLSRGMWWLLQLWRGSVGVLHSPSSVRGVLWQSAGGDSVRNQARQSSIHAAWHAVRLSSLGGEVSLWCGGRATNLSDDRSHLEGTARAICAYCRWVVTAGPYCNISFPSSTV